MPAELSCFIIFAFAQRGAKKSGMARILCPVVSASMRKRSSNSYCVMVFSFQCRFYFPMSFPGRPRVPVMVSRALLSSSSALPAAGAAAVGAGVCCARKFFCGAATVVVDLHTQLFCFLSPAFVAGDCVYTHCSVDVGAGHCACPAPCVNQCRASTGRVPLCVREGRAKNMR